jgi:hypothetical protein
LILRPGPLCRRVELGAAETPLWLERGPAMPRIFDEVVLAIDHAGFVADLGGLRMVDERAGPGDAFNLEQNEDVVGLLDAAPGADKTKSGVPVGGDMRIEDGPPPIEVSDSVPT